jgi:hypothetical protein
MAQFFFYFLEKYLKKFFVLPTLPSNEKNSFDHYNSYKKGPNLVFFSFIESSCNFLLTIKVPKNHITSSYHSNMPKQQRPFFGHHRGLGVNDHFQNLHILFSLLFSKVTQLCKGNVSNYLTLCRLFIYSVEYGNQLAIML